MFKRTWERRRDAAWTDLEQRLGCYIRAEDRLDRFIAVEYYGNPPNQPGRDGFFYIARRYLYFAPHNSHEAIAIALSRVVEIQWDPDEELFVIVYAMTGQPGEYVGWAYRPYGLTSQILSEVLEAMGKARAGCPAVSEAQLWPADGGAGVGDPKTDSIEAADSLVWSFDQAVAYERESRPRFPNYADQLLNDLRTLVYRDALHVGWVPHTAVQQWVATASQTVCRSEVPVLPRLLELEGHARQELSERSDATGIEVLDGVMSRLRATRPTLQP